jgi:hypothetical protein
MSRLPWLVPLLWAVLAAVSARAGVSADSLAAPAGKDTIRAGGMTIVGDVVKPPGEEGDTISTSRREELKRTLTMLASKKVPGLHDWERRKVPKVAMFSSVVLPGLGQVYNGRRIKVGLAAGFFSVYLSGAWLNWRDAQAWTAYRDNLPEGTSTAVIRYANQRIEFHKETSRDFVWWSAAIWVINVLDAWIDAHLFDLRAYTPPADIGASQSSTGMAPRWTGRPIHYLTYTATF